MANGPCLVQVIAAARMTPETYDAPTIKTMLAITNPSERLLQTMNSSASAKLYTAAPGPKTK